MNGLAKPPNPASGRRRGQAPWPRLNPGATRVGDRIVHSVSAVPETAWRAAVADPAVDAIQVRRMDAAAQPPPAPDRIWKRIWRIERPRRAAGRPLTNSVA